MENASKALLIAGGMLLAMLLVSLFIYAWGLFSEYQSSNDKLKNIENVAKFNEQFTNYDRQDVQGYELISLVNKVVDYNERKTSDTKYGNDEQYPPITLTIKITNVDKFQYDNKERLLKNQKYEDNKATSRNSNSKSSFEVNVLNKLESALTLPDGSKINEDSATKVAKNIGSIFLSKEQIELKANGDRYGRNINNVYLEMVNTFKLATGLPNGDTGLVEFAKNNLVLGTSSSTTKPYYEYACIYYEYMQFKRGVFKCENLEYHSASGRVNKIEFEFTGKIH